MDYINNGHDPMWFKHIIKQKRKRRVINKIAKQSRKVNRRK